MKKIIQLSVLLFLVGCNQDSLNIQQIGNMQFFIDNESKGGINVVESGLQYSILSSGDQSSKSP